jgi:hypothetical protein
MDLLTLQAIFYTIGPAISSFQQDFNRQQNSQLQAKNTQRLQTEFDASFQQREEHHSENITTQKEQFEQAHQYRLAEPNWPLMMSPQEYAHDTTTHDRQPLIVMLSPPPENDSRFHEVIKDIENGLRALLQKNYDANDPKRPVYFGGKAWKKGCVGGETPAKILHHALHQADTPTLIIDLEMVDKDLHIHTHCWGIGQSNELKHTACDIVLPLSHYIAEVARKHAREWGEISNLLGRDATPSKIDKQNWLILQAEQALCQKDPQRGTSFYVRHYDYGDNVSYLREAVREIIPALQLLVSSMADIYHLYRYSTPPYLPILLESLITDTTDPRVKSLMIQITENYTAMIDFLADKYPENAHNFHLEMAEGFSGLADLRLCEGYVLKSLRAWRKLRGAEKIEGNDAIALLEKMGKYLKPEDEEFLNRMRGILVAPLEWEEAFQEINWMANRATVLKMLTDEQWQKFEEARTKKLDVHTPPKQDEEPQLQNVMSSNGENQLSDMATSMAAGATVGAVFGSVVPVVGTWFGGVGAYAAQIIYCMVKADK